MQEEELGPGFDLAQRNSKKIFRLILLHVSENHWFNSNTGSTDGWNPSLCNSTLKLHTHSPTAARTVFRCTPVSHPGQRTFPFLLPIDYFRYNILRKSTIIQQLHKCQKIKPEYASFSSKQNSQTSIRGPNRASLKFCLYKKFYLPPLLYVV